jgi:hypothetical protein
MPKRLARAWESWYSSPHTPPTDRIGPFIPRPQGCISSGKPTTDHIQSTRTWISEVSRLLERLVTRVESALLIDDKQRKSFKINALREYGDMHKYWI